MPLRTAGHPAAERFAVVGIGTMVVIVPMHLGEVVILEAGVELLDEVIDGDHRFVRKRGEHEQIWIVVQVVHGAPPQRAPAARRERCVSGGAKTCR
ncbi:MAG: hypothetical protein IPI06_03775 [Gammaproteobacteria bacterium]|nr:hypothetical protein [Gammaproteobacteria bacterium]